MVSHRERADQESQSDRVARREARGDRERGSAARQGRSVPHDEDPDLLPSWAEEPTRGSIRAQPDRGGSGRSKGITQGARPPIPELGEAFRHPRRGDLDSGTGPELDAARDPYDRLRRVASRPARRVEFDDEFEPDHEQPWEDDDFQRRTPRPRRRASAASGRPRRSPASKQLGGMISAADSQAKYVVAVAGLAIVSLVFMAATVAGRTSALPAWMPIHSNAQGNPDLWGDPNTIWRIPLMVAILTIMSAAVAWFVSKGDPFAARFALGTVILVHAMSWIGLVALAW